METTYNIACVADENYCRHTGVMLCSLFEMNPGRRFRVTLLTTDIRPGTASELKRLCDSYGAEFSYRPCTLDRFAGYPTGQWSRIMYLKLLLPAMMPAGADRCLFLDSDMVVNQPVDNLYNIDMGGCVIAAAEDMPDCAAYKKRLGLSAADNYVNSGVMVCDLERWRLMEQSMGIQLYANSAREMIRNEQDVIALYFRGLIKLLPIKWNMTSFYFMREPMIFSKYLDQLDEARKDPAIIHFACPIKPWYADSQHPYLHLYMKYLEMTPWRGTERVDFEQRSLYGRIKRKIRRALNEANIIKDPLYYIK